jgi:hypothetical protein
MPPAGIAAQPGSGERPARSRSYGALRTAKSRVRPQSRARERLRMLNRSERWGRWE